VRHSAGYAAINADVGVRDLQDFLGHRSINSTTRYAALPSGRLKSIVECRQAESKRTGGLRRVIAGLFCGLGIRAILIRAGLGFVAHGIHAQSNLLNLSLRWYPVCTGPRIPKMVPARSQSAS
jgi:hypothetical protein